MHGLELIFDTALLSFRALSLSYWMRNWLPGPYDAKHVIRDNAIDLYCILQLLVLVVVSLYPIGSMINSIVVAYILFEIYLNLLNIVFIGKLRAINSPPASIERSLLLLGVNVFEVVLAFGILYRDWIGLSAASAFLHAVLVLGTIGYPAADGPARSLVAAQVLLDLVLIALVFSSFVGQLGLFRSDHDANQSMSNIRLKLPDGPGPAPPAG